MTLTIGEIDYANCIPIFSALRESCDCSAYRFVRGVPAELNEQLRTGLIDVSPSSSVAFACHPEQYEILPDLSISAIGQVRSVLLISRRPLEELAGRRVGLTVESATSVILLQILLHREEGVPPVYERTALPPDEAFDHYEAILQIGDAALREREAVEGRLVYDLGELWHSLTGLPFVFALWFVRRDVARTRHGEVARLAEQLLVAKRQAYASYERIAAMTDSLPWLPRPLLVDYWRTISYDLTPAHLAGLAEFYRRGSTLGLLPGSPEPRLFS